MQTNELYVLWMLIFKKIDLSNFNANNVTDMSYMFYDCSSLSILYLSNFNTDNVIYISDIFYECI